MTLNAPSSGATYTAPAVILLSASASDPENALTRVEFYSGSTLIGTAAAAPYVFTWTAVPAGTYMLRAVAYDGAGASASSATATVTVANPLVLPPTGVAFTPSVDHASVTRYELRIYASGANPLAATAIAASDLGKPTPDATGDITVDRAAFFSNLGVGELCRGSRGDWCRRRIGQHGRDVHPLRAIRGATDQRAEITSRPPM